MNIRSLNQTVSRVPPPGPPGMTLVEVVIALAVAGLTLGGIVEGYIYSTTAAVKAGLAQAANARAMERLEETRSARWDTASWPVVDQLQSTNFPDQVVSLDMPGSTSGGTSATIKTKIFQISATPPIRGIRVDCIWNFRGDEVITNTIESIRAPDQ